MSEFDVVNLMEFDVDLPDGFAVDYAARHLIATWNPRKNQDGHAVIERIREQMLKAQEDGIIVIYAWHYYPPGDTRLLSVHFQFTGLGQAVIHIMYL